MQIIQNISNEARQKHTILLDEDSSRIVLEFTYKPDVIGWFLDVTYDKLNFSVKGLRIVTTINLLNQWRNILPFGILVSCKDSQDPLLLDDFLVKRAKIGITNKEEVGQLLDLMADIKEQ